MASENWHVVGKRFSSFWIRIYCWVAMGTWLPATPSLCKCTSHCSSSWAVSYDLRGSIEGEKPQEKSLYKKDVILILAQTSLLWFFSNSEIFLYFIFSVLVLTFPHPKKKKIIISFCRLGWGLENQTMSMTEIMVANHSTCNALPACPTLSGSTPFPLLCVILIPC